MSGTMESTMNQVLKSHQPPRPEGLMRLTYWVIFATSLLYLLIIAQISVFLTPKFMMMFKERGLELPAITKIFLSLSYQTWVGIFAGIGLFMLLKEFLIKKWARKFALQTGLLISFHFFIVLYFLAMVLPLYRISGPVK